MIGNMIRKKVSVNKFAKKTFAYMVAGSLALGILCPISVPASPVLAAEMTTMSESEGAMFLDGEELTLSFAESERLVLPISLSNDSYISMTRTDSESAALSAKIQSKSSTAKVPEDTYTLAKDVSSKVIQLSAGEYFIVFEGTVGTTYNVKSEVSLGVPMKLGEKISLKDVNSETAYRYQFTANQNGYMCVENLTKNTKLDVKLLSEDNKVLSKINTLSKYSKSNQKNLKNKTGFGIKEGKTYVLVVQADDDTKSLSFKTSTKWKKKYYKTIGGSSYGSAKTIKKGKTYYCTFAAGENPGYYTFKKTSYARNMALKTNTLKNQGNVKMLLFYKEVKGPKKGQILPVKVNGKQIGYTTKSMYQNVLKIPAGWPNVTYYVVYKRSNAKASGSFQLKLS